MQLSTPNQTTTGKGLGASVHRKEEDMRKSDSSLDSGRVTFRPRIFDPSNVTDPVCGAEMPLEDAAASSNHQGQTRYFCSPSCKLRFLEEPDAYS